MKEELQLPPHLDGTLWKFRASRVHRPHRHRELELNLVTQGHARYLIEGRVFEMNPRTSLWLFPAQEHALLEQSADYEMWILVFRPRLLRRACRDTGNRELTRARPTSEFCRSLGAQSFGRLVRRCEELVALQTEFDSYNAGLGYVLLRAWAAHLSHESAVLSADLHPAVEKAARLLQTRPQGEMNLAALARTSGLSPARLSRLFKQQTGVSLVDFRNRQRLDTALHRYGRGQRVTLLEAALEAGFGSYVQFYRVFRRFLHRTPAEYSREIAASAEL